MKQITTLLVLILVSSCCLHAQNNFPNAKNPPRPAWIEFNNGNDIGEGFIRSLTDSSLLFARQRALLKDIQTIHPETQILSYKDIETLHVHRAGSTWKGLGIGAAAGALLGALIGDLVARPRTDTVGEVFGAPVEETITRQDYIKAGAVLGTVGGIIVGTIVGAVAHKKFIIQGKIERFREMQKKAKIIP